MHEHDPKMKIADIVDGDRLGKCVTSTCDTYMVWYMPDTVLYYKFTHVQVTTVTDFYTLGFRIECRVRISSQDRLAFTAACVQSFHSRCLRLTYTPVCLRLDSFAGHYSYAYYT